MEDRVRELEESIRVLNERINNNYIENYDNVSIEELERISRDINSAEVDSRVFGEIVTLEILDNRDEGVDFLSIARVANMVDEFTEETREKLVNIDKEIRKRNDQIETVRRERLEIARKLVSLDGEIRLIKDFTEEDEATLNRMQSNDDQFKKFILDDIKELETKRANYERKVGLVEERSKLKEEYDNLTNRINMISSGKLDLEKSNDYIVEDLPEVEKKDEINEVNSGLSDVEEPTEEETNEEKSVIPVPLASVSDDSTDELSDVDTENLELPTPLTEENSDDVLPTPLEEDSENTEFILPPQLEDESDEVVNVSQPKSGLWSKVKKVLGAAAIFLLTLTVGGIVAKRINQNDKPVDEDLSQNDFDNTQDEDPNITPEPTPTPEPSNPTPTPKPSEPTPTPKPSEPTPTPEPSEPTPTPKPSEPTPTPEPSNPTPTPKPSDPTPTPDVQVELNTDGSETVYDTTTGVEVTSDGTAYQHNEDGTTEKLPDVELDETDHNTVIVDGEDLQNDQSTEPSIPPIGDEETLEDALANGSLSEGELDNLLDSVEGYDWASDFDVPTR